MRRPPRQLPLLPGPPARRLRRAAARTNGARRQLLAILLAVGFASASPASPVLVIRGGLLFDPVAGALRPSGAVVIAGDRIRSVSGPDEPVDTPPDAVVVDAAGKYLLPGLIDGHAHVAHVLQAAGVGGEEVMPLYLAAGVTTLRDVGDRLDGQQAVARFIDAHPGRAPRLFLGSPLFDGASPYHAGVSIPITDAGQVAPEVDRLAAAGVRTFKVYVGLDRARGSAVIREAHRHGRRATAHLRAYAPLDAVADGIDAIEHIESIFDFVTPPAVPRWPLRDERTHMTAAEVAQLRRHILEEQVRTDFSSPRAQELVAALARQGVLVDPTLVVYRNWMLLADPDEVQAHPDLAHVPGRLRHFWRLTIGGAGASPELADLRRRQLRKLQELTGVLHRAGVRLLAGTDAPIHFCPPGLALHQELELLVASGLTPAAALTAATRHNALALDEWRNLGSIEPGKLADLVILDADPLADIRHTRRISLVVRGGLLCDPAELLQLVPSH